VREELLTGYPDEDVWQAAQKEQRFVITQDLDFSDLRAYQGSSHHGVLLLRLQFPSRAALTARVQRVFMTDDVESWKGCLVVATEKKLRVRRTG
jgi:predicted nuclease of predicted toxin-antitoxin system